MRFNKSKQNIEGSLVPPARYGLIIPEGARSLRLGFLTIVVERISGFPDHPGPNIVEDKRARAEASITRENVYIPMYYQPMRQLTR